MKKLRFVAIISVFVLSVLLISGCAKQKYEKLTFDWVDDIKAITLRKEMNYYDITDKNDIKKLIDNGFPKVYEKEYIQTLLKVYRLIHQ